MQLLDKSLGVAQVCAILTGKPYLGVCMLQIIYCFYFILYFLRRYSETEREREKQKETERCNDPNPANPVGP